MTRGWGGQAAHARRLLGGAAALALAAALGAVAIPASAVAQDIDDLRSRTAGSGPMLLEADTLVYDNDRRTVTAAGGVQIDYDGNRMVARRVTYNQTTGRLVASGEVEIVERDGNRIYAEEIDVTDDFRDGFVNALRIETVDDTYFAAESAERRAGTVTTFNNGVYTACEPCEDSPGKAPIWRIKAQKIIWNGETRVVRFERARFELFGLPIAFLPAFEMADPTVRRKSGFLFPSASYSKELGFGVSVPYYFALSPTFDLTVWGKGYTRQGFLGEAEFRQRFDNGGYSVKIAGIYQLSPQAFRPAEVDSRLRGRFMVGTKGEFKVNPRWTFGWDVLAQSDPNFSNRYDISGYGEVYRRNQVYLNGFNDRNSFELSFNKFQVQETLPRSSVFARDPKQPWVLPSLDYRHVSNEPVAGGELSFGVNVQGIHRDTLDINPATGVPQVVAVRGVEGWSGRTTAEAEWKRRMVMPGGLVVTPMVHGRSDAIGVDPSAASVAAIQDQAAFLSGVGYSHDGRGYGPVGADVRSSYYRAMATAGLEVRWPVLFSTTSASHVLEPIGQLFVRPDAPHETRLGIPNEDAQSLVFDATSLFERDKFSGYDRIEGGTRANLGIRYSGSFANGWSAMGLFGQSYHLAGRNPYASPDLVGVGAYSGLETNRSDYVAMVGFSSPTGHSMSLGGRFDESSFELRRLDARAGTRIGLATVGARYSFIEAQPVYGFPADRREVGGNVTLQLTENWKVLGGSTYDLQSRTFVSTGFGFAYDDECFTYGMTFTRTQNTVSRDVSSNVMFRVALRTLGEFGSSSSALNSFSE